MCLILLGKTIIAADETFCHCHKVTYSLIVIEIELEKQLLWTKKLFVIVIK